jgi:site-specific recombinase XerD
VSPPPKHRGSPEQFRGRLVINTPPYSREFTAQRKAAGLKAITLGKLRHSNISRMCAAGIAGDVVAAWHGHTERMTQAVYGRVTDDRLTAASAVFSAAVGQS